MKWNRKDKHASLVIHKMLMTVMSFTDNYISAYVAHDCIWKEATIQAMVIMSQQ